MKYLILLLSIFFSFVVEAKLKFEFSLTDSFPPFTVVEGKKISGPFLDIANLVCKKINAECTYSVFPYARAFYEVEDGKMDGLFAVLKTKKREEQFYFSENILKSSFSLYAQKDLAITYKTPDDIKGYSVAVFGPSGSQAFAESLYEGKTEIVKNKVRNTIVLLKMLSLNHFNDKSVGVVNTDVANYIVKKEHITGLKEVAKLSDINLTFAFSRKKTNIKDYERFNSALRQLIKDGTVKKILDKYKMQEPLNQKGLAGLI